MSDIDSDYTSDINYPTTHHPHSSVHQYGDLYRRPRGDDYYMSDGERDRCHDDKGHNHQDPTNRMNEYNNNRENPFGAHNGYPPSAWDNQGPSYTGYEERSRYPDEVDDAHNHSQYDPIQEILNSQVQVGITPTGKGPVPMPRKRTPKVSDDSDAYSSPYHERRSESSEPFSYNSRPIEYDERRYVICCSQLV